MPEKRLTTVGNFPTAAEAHAARLRLASQGIEAMLVDEALVGNFWHLGNAVGGIKLQVDAADHSRARHLLAEGESLSAGDSGQPAAWVCSECRERVPANFDVCWSCGALRGPADAEAEQSPERQISEPRNRETSNLAVREAVCSACGALLSASGVCGQCGQTTAPNPYKAPLHATPAANTLATGKTPTGELRERRREADALAQRAWKAAIFGTLILPPLLSIYSIVLLVTLAERHSRLSPRMFRRIAWAWAMNVTVVLIMTSVFLSWFR